MRRALPLALLCLFASPALAQDDNPIPYPELGDDEDAPRRPKNSEPTGTVPDAEERLTLEGYDDPSYGFAAELLGALMLLESSQGGGVSPRFGWGARLTWEVGRLFRNDRIHDGLFLDASWLYTAARDGTTQVSVGANYHYFTLAPAFGFAFGPSNALALYGQIGGGITYQYGVLESDAQLTTVAGVKPTFLYGVGLRGRPLTSEDTGLRIVFRIELTRFRRSYMDDTYFGASLGAGF